MTAQPDPAADLRKATAKYRREKKRIAALQKKNSDEFAAAIRKAHVGGGMMKSKIIIAIDNEWSRSWVDRACSHAEPESGGDE